MHAWMGETYVLDTRSSKMTNLLTHTFRISPLIMSGCSIVHARNYYQPSPSVRQRSGKSRLRVTDAPFANMVTFTITFPAGATGTAIDWTTDASLV